MKKYLQSKYLWLFLIGLFTLTLSSCDDPLTSGMKPVIDAVTENSEAPDTMEPISDFQPCLTTGSSGFWGHTSKVVDDPNIAHAVIYISKVWNSAFTVDPFDDKNLIVITVDFLDGSGLERSVVKETASQWTLHGRFSFQFVESGASDIRIGFDPNDGHWSYIGIDARGKQKTMNLALSGERYPARVILHEFGHALGMAHEHQNPAVPIQWDEDAVIEELKQTQGWTEETIRHNVLNPLDINQTNFTSFDPESIMLYPIPNRWTIGNFETGYNAELSLTDQYFIGETYGRLTSFIDDMVPIPAGDFQMGSNWEDHPDVQSDELPVHTVYVDAFYMDKYEVTNAEYKEFIDANPRWRKSQIDDRLHNGAYLHTWNGDNYPVGRDDHPVINVSWYAAMAYAKSKGKRLPTEAEWEKAARGGLVGKLFPSGNEFPWRDANLSSSSDTKSVGGYTPNGYGLYNMAGNVSEWCLDAFDEDFYAFSPRRNPFSDPNNITITQLLRSYLEVDPFSQRVYRGGSYAEGGSHPYVANRRRTNAQFCHRLLGFRCVKDVN